jgi:hypothetical protein
LFHFQDATKISHRKAAKHAEEFDFSVAGDQPSLKLWHGKEAGNGKPPRRFAAELGCPEGRPGFGLPPSQRKAKQLKKTFAISAP